MRGSSFSASFFEAQPDLSPDLEEAFLERVLWFEKESKRPLRERLAETGIVMEDPCRLMEDDLSRQLWQVIHALITLQISPANTDHLSDRELYTCLWEIVSSGVPGTAPEYFSRGWYVDLTASAHDNMDTYLKYYASEPERQAYRRRFPDRTIPPHVDPPYDRDRLIPDF